MTQSKKDVFQSGYNFRVFDTATGKTIKLCRTRAEADKEIDRWKRRCERKKAEFAAILIDETPEK